MANILVADDNQDVALLVSERLRLEGHQIEWVPAGDIALEKLKTNAYDLAILDVIMPGRDGLSVCYTVKHSDDYKKLPILLMSAYSQDEKNIHRSMADAFLPKPFELSQLLLIVNRLLMHSQERKA